MLLAIEFSTKAKSVAILDRGAALSMCVATDAPGAPGLFSLIAQSLHEARAKAENLTTVAVGLGPGSSMGIRQALAAGIGFRHALGIQLVGVPSIDGIAFLAAETLANRSRPEVPAIDSVAQTIWSGELTVATSAQRGDWHVRDYDLARGGVREKGPIRLEPGAVVEAAIKTGRIVCGPDLPLAWPKAWECFPNARSIGLLAFDGKGVMDHAAARLEPIHLRAAQYAKAPPPRSGP